MEEVVLKVSVQGGEQASKSVNSLKQELRAAKLAAEQAAEGTEEYFKAISKAAEAKDRLEDINKAVNALNPGDKAAAFGQLFNTIAGGFQTVTGLYGLLGAQSEEVEKILLKVQSASALAMGVQSLVEASKQWDNLKAVILDTFNSISNFAKASIFGGIVAGTAIVYEFVKSLDASKKAAEDAAKAAKEKAHFTDLLNSVESKAVQIYAKEKASLDLLVNTAKNDKLAKSARIEAVKKLNELSPKYLEGITLENINTEKTANSLAKYNDELLRRAKLQAANDSIVQAYQKLFDAELKLKTAQEERLKKSDEIAAKTNKQIQDFGQIDKAINTNINNINALNDANIDAIKTTIDKTNADIDYLNSFVQANGGIVESSNKTTAELKDDGNEYYLWKIEQQRKSKELADKEIELQTKFGLTIEEINSEWQNSTITDYGAFLDNLAQQKSNYFQKVKDDYLSSVTTQDLLDANRMLDEQLMADFDIPLAQIDTKYLEWQEKNKGSYADYMAWLRGALQKEKDIRQEADEKIRTARLGMAQNTLDGLTALGELFINDERKRVKFQKIATIAQLALDTAKAISNTIANATQAAAAGGPAAPALQAAYITSGIAQVLASFLSAKKALQDNSLNQIAGGGAGGTAVSAPQINTPTNQQSFTTPGTDENGTFKVFVTETDITNTQQAVSGNLKKALLTI